MSGYGEGPYGEGGYGGTTTYEMPPFPSPLPTFATTQEALDAANTSPLHAVYVISRTQGAEVLQTVEVISWDAQFGTDRAIATGTFEMSLPRPDIIEANTEIEIIAGHNNYTGTVFNGRVTSWRSNMDIRSRTVTVRAVGWSSLLNYPERFDLTYDGDIPLSSLFDSLCARRGVPYYRADTVTDPTGTIEITLGGNAQIDEGKVIIPSSQSPLSFLNARAEPFGYRVYDTPSGVVRLSRVSGMPVGDSVATFTQGIQILSARSEYDIEGITNYWDVHGPTYEDTTGGLVPIRAFPAEIESNPLIPVNDGVVYNEYRNSSLVKQHLAEIVRNVLEIDNGAPDEPVMWESIAVPGISVGDVISVDCGEVEVDGDYWLTDLDIALTDRGLTATYGGWVGGAEALPAGNNRVETVIRTAPLHLGDETLSHYAVSSPSGTEYEWDFSLSERATVVNIRGLHHGTNSQLIGGVNTDLEVTKWEVWLPDSDYDDDDQRPETSGNMPIVNENLLQRLDYDNLANWSPFAISLRSLDPGDYVLRLVCGEKAAWDDFEVRDVILETYGEPEPAIIPESE